MRTGHDVSLGLERLLGAPRDVKPDDGLDIPLAQAPVEWRALFTAWRRDLGDVHDVVSAIWEADIDARVEDGASVAAAIEDMMDGGVAGPAADRDFVALVRRTWLAAAALGDTGPVRIRPEVVLLRWLADGGDHDLVQLVTAMPYWPVGLDGDGRWV